MHYDVFRTWWGPVRSAVAAGTAPPSFVRDALHPDARYTGDDEIAMYLALSVISAESDNTQLTLNAFAIARCAILLSLPERAQRLTLCAETKVGEMAGRIRRTGRTAGLEITRASASPVLQTCRPSLSSARS